MIFSELLTKLDFKNNGLIPVIVQDVNTKTVLMLAYVNKEALDLTIKTGKATYWSRSRNEIWVKGETSGHTQQIIEISVDCDYDTLLFMVKQKDNACHTGSYSCFFNKLQ